MIALVLALTLASPQPLQQCAETCHELQGYARCYVTPRPKCGRREFVCVSSDAVDCVPLVVSLGTWSYPRDVGEPVDWPAITPPPLPAP